MYFPFEGLVGDGHKVVLSHFKPDRLWFLHHNLGQLILLSWHLYIEIYSQQMESNVSIIRKIVNKFLTIDFTYLLFIIDLDLCFVTGALSWNHYLWMVIYRRMHYRLYLQFFMKAWFYHARLQIAGLEYLAIAFCVDRCLITLSRTGRKLILANFFIYWNGILSRIAFIAGNWHLISWKRKTRFWIMTRDVEV